MDCGLSGSSIHGILRARILEWLPFPSPGDLTDPGIEPASLTSFALAGEFLMTSTTCESPTGIILRTNFSPLHSQASQEGASCHVLASGFLGFLISLSSGVRVTEGSGMSAQFLSLS